MKKWKLWVTQVMEVNSISFANVEGDISGQLWTTCFPHMVIPTPELRCDSQFVPPEGPPKTQSPVISMEPNLARKLSPLPLLLLLIAPLTAISNSGSTTKGAYGRVPLHFERNHGQFPTGVQYGSRGPGYTVLLEAHQAKLQVRGDEKTAGLTMELLNAKQAHPVEQGLLPGKIHYLLGRDPGKWQRNVSTFGRVRYPRIYPGIDLVYYGNQQQLEYDFVVSPNADPRAIKLKLSGYERARIDRNGDLLLMAGGGEIRWRAPVSYQLIDGNRKSVRSKYVLKKNGEIAFAVGHYDRSRELIIDPVIVYSTFIGGRGSEYGRSITVDGAGNAYITGEAGSASFPTTSGAYDRVSPGGDAFVAKFSPSGALIYSTFLGGSGFDRANGITVDSQGAVYIAGETSSTDFPVKNALQSNLRGERDAFVTKLNSTGSGLVYSTYLGGSGVDVLNGIAVHSGTAYVVGNTNSEDMPTQNAEQGVCKLNNSGYCSDAYIARLSATGSSLIFGTYLGGAGPGIDFGGDDRGHTIDVDSDAAAYVGGDTTSSDFPLTRSFGTDGPDDNSPHGYVTKFTAQGDLVWSITVGNPNAFVTVTGLDVDGAKNVFFTGWTEGSGYPVTQGAFKTSTSGTESFVTKLNSSGDTLLYSTYLGGSGADAANAVDVDDAGRAWVVGRTNSLDFPLQNATDSTPGDPTPLCEGPESANCEDGFVSVLNASGSGLAFSTYLGGADIDQARDIATRGASGFVVGDTEAPEFTTVNAYDATFNGGETDVFVARFSLDGGTGACAAPSSRGLNICTPQDGATVTSPVQISAAANGGSSNITGMKIYVDGSQKAQSSSNTIQASVSLAAGQHSITVRAWDATGAWVDKTIFITVSGTSGACTPQSSAGVKICSPPAGSVIPAGSVRITAETTSSSPVIATKVYIDGVVKRSESDGSIDYTQTLTVPGERRLTVKSWTQSGTILSKTIVFTIQ